MLYQKTISKNRSENFIPQFTSTVSKISNRGWEKLKEALETLSNDTYIDENYKSFLLDFGYTHLYIYGKAEQNLDFAEERAFSLLRKHRQKFDLLRFDTYYLTSTELNIINRLSYLYRLKNEPATAIYILEKSKAFQEEKQLDRDSRGFRPIYISTIMHLADTFLISSHFEEALKLFDTHGLKNTTALNWL